MEGPILVATDGTDGALGALRLARALAGRGSVTPRVLAVYTPLPLYDVPPSLPQAQAAVDQAGVRRLREAVRAQLERLGPDACGWEVAVECGPAAEVIAARAREVRAALVALGLGRHALVDRWLGGETALRVMHLADVPVLAAHPGARDLPRRALAADDFSACSREAALGALSLLAGGGELHLAHVVQLPAATPEGMAAAGWLDGYLDRAQEELERRRAGLEEAGGARVHAHTLQGEPAPELLRLAGSLGADLIAAGRHGLGFLGRLLVGSVSTRLVRRAQCSVLVAPEAGREG